MIETNWIGVILAAISAMVVGYVWYGPLFGKPWMKLVGITKEDIEKVCRNPIQTVFDSDRKNFKSVGKIEDKYYPADTYLVVIHTKEVDRVIHIISAMYTSQGGLPRFGFSNL